MKTHYDLLNVPADADPETVKAAYRKIVKTHHPDLNKGDHVAEVRSKQIITAYAVLRDPEQRARYDEQLRNRRGQVRRFVITVVVIAGLVSGSTLFFLNFLLKPETGAPLTRISASATEKLASAQEIVSDAVAAPLPVPAPAPPQDQAATPQQPAQPSGVLGAAWLQIEQNGSAEEIWAFVKAHPGTPEAALAAKRLQHLAHATGDDAGVNAAAIPSTGSGAEPAQDSAAPSATAKEIVTAALPAQGVQTRPSDTAPAQDADTALPPQSEHVAVAPESAAKLASSDPRPPIHQAMTFMSSDDYTLAKPESRDSPPIAPGNASYYVHRAAASVVRGDLERALADYDAAILLDDANIEALHGRGLVRSQRGEMELALTDLDRAIRLSFSDPKIYLDRGMIWYQRGRYDRAIADFNQAIKLAPSLASAYSFRGTALRRKRDFKSAIADLDQAIRLNPAIVGAYQNRDLARTERDDPADMPSEAAR